MSEMTFITRLTVGTH